MPLVRQLLQKLLRDLYGVRGRSFADVVRDDPDVDAVFNGVVSSDSADVNFVSSRSIQCQRINVVLHIVLNDESRELPEALDHILKLKRLLELDVDGFAA